MASTYRWAVQVSCHSKGCVCCGRYYPDKLRFALGVCRLVGVRMILHDLKSVVCDGVKAIAGVVLELLWVFGDIVELGIELFSSFWAL